MTVFLFILFLIFCIFTVILLVLPDDYQNKKTDRENKESKYPMIKSRFPKN